MITRRSLLVLATLCWTWALLLSGGLAGITSVFSKFLKHERGWEEVRIGSVMVVSFVLSSPCPYCAVRLNPLQRYLESICCVGAILALSWSDAAVMKPNSLWRQYTSRLVVQEIRKACSSSAYTRNLLHNSTSDSLYCQSNRIRLQTLFPGDKAAATQLQCRNITTERMRPTIKEKWTKPQG